MKLTVAWIAIAILVSGAAFRQSGRLPSFEIADIHASISRSNPTMRGPLINGSRYEIRSANMVDLVSLAYGVETDKVLGGPIWLELDRFDVVAKVPDGTKPDTKIMLRTLLAERFKLIIHNDSSPTTVYALTATKKPLLKPADGAGDTGCRLQQQSVAAGSSGTRSINVNGNRVDVDSVAPLSFSCHNMTMKSFVEAIPALPSSGMTRYTVVDQTGLAGAWNFDIKYHLPVVPAVAATLGDRISFIDAVQKQLGLEINLTKAPLPVIVVDSANEKPTDNPTAVAELLPAPPSEFEVADIKPTAADFKGSSSQIQPGGRVIIRGLSLRSLILRAWEIYANRPDDLLSGPSFLATERFDIVAKAPAPAILSPLDPASASNGSTLTTMYDNPVNQMLKSLLIDRFKMVFHVEERPLPAFTLTAVKPKLQRADPSNRTSFRENPVGAGNSRSWTCRNITMAQFAASLKDMAGGYIQNKDVLDATGLDGAWDFTFSFSMAASVGAGLRGETGDASGTPTAATPDSSFTLPEAMEKQLGLKLEMTKRPGPVLVIDHMEQKPTDN